MKKLILLSLIAAGFWSCELDKENQDVTSQSIVNDLLPKKVIVYNEVNFANQSIEEWTQGVDQDYFSSLNEKVINSDVKLESAMVYFQEEESPEMTKEDVLANMNKEDSAHISSLYFIESWHFNQATYKLEKTVEAWSPVYEFVKNENGVERPVKKLLYDVKSSADKANKLIAENITYEVNFDTEFKTNEYLNIDMLAKLTVEPMLEGKVKAYDFFDDAELDVVSMRRSMGYISDTLITINPQTNEDEVEVVEVEEDISSVRAYIFVEDWYIDEQTFAIKKHIKGIAPVAISSIVDEDGEVIEYRRIVGLVKFNN
jgi:hypothetical protein